MRRNLPSLPCQPARHAANPVRASPVRSPASPPLGQAQLEQIRLAALLGLPHHRLSAKTRIAAQQRRLVLRRKAIQQLPQSRAEYFEVKADIAAAKAIKPDIDKDFAAYGVK
jgi:hypothetical protein